MVRYAFEGEGVIRALKDFDKNSLSTNTLIASEYSS
jgi:hypothetical protein